MDSCQDSTIQYNGRTGTARTPKQTNVQEFITKVGVCKVMDWYEKCSQTIDIYKINRYKKTFVYECDGEYITLRQLLNYLNIETDE